MVSSDTVLFDLADKVAVITLNRPAVRNAMNRELRQALAEALHRVREEDDIRAAVITGAGRTFSAGADLKERAQVGRAGDANAASVIEASRTAGFARMAVEKPFIAAIDGYCLAAGFELALLCDIRICTADARFGLPEIVRGFFPGGGGPQRLIRERAPAHGAPDCSTDRRPRAVGHQSGNGSDPGSPGRDARAIPALRQYAALDHRPNRGCTGRPARLRRETRATIPRTLTAGTSPGATIVTCIALRMPMDSNGLCRTHEQFTSHRPAYALSVSKSQEPLEGVFPADGSAATRVNPRLWRICCSIAAANSECSLRYFLAFSRPWPIRSSW
jgi:hypothetical protein